MELKDLVVDTKSAWVDYPGLKGFQVEIANLGRPALQSLRKKCMTSKFDRKTRMAVETLDEEKYIAEFTRATIKNWRGLKASYLEEMVLVDLTGHDPEKEIPYSPSNAELLVSRSAQFDEWLTDAVFDLDNFRTRSERASVEAPNKVAK